MLSTPPRPLHAIAAMAENRVIGNRGKIPWHLPDDFKFFKKMTLGNVLVMGRKTFESIGRPLPGRVTVVLSRNAGNIAGAIVIGDWAALWEIEPEKQLFVAGGAELYAQALPRCETLFLTHVRGTPEGDTFFPAHEEFFDAGVILEEHPEFSIRKHRALPSSSHR